MRKEKLDCGHVGLVGMVVGLRPGEEPFTLCEDCSAKNPIVVERDPTAVFGCEYTREELLELLRASK